MRDALRFITWGLPDNGALAASVRGGHSWLGWGQDRSIAVDQWDLAAAAAAGKKAPKWPRPKRKRRSTPSALDRQRPARESPPPT